MVATILNYQKDLIIEEGVWLVFKILMTANVEIGF